MRRSPKQTGTEAETAVATYLRPRFPDVTRLALAGAADIGDLGGIPGLTVQIKSHKTMALSSWVDQALTQKARAGTRFACVIHKRVRKGNPKDWYVTLPLEDFATMYERLVKMPARQAR